MEAVQYPTKSYVSLRFMKVMGIGQLYTKNNKHGEIVLIKG